MLSRVGFYTARHPIFRSAQTLLPSRPVQSNAMTLGRLFNHAANFAHDSTKKTSIVYDEDKTNYS